MTTINLQLVCVYECVYVSLIHTQGAYTPWNLQGVLTTCILVNSSWGSKFEASNVKFIRNALIHIFQKIIRFQILLSEMHRMDPYIF